jgi:hypothetical protein
MLYRRRLRLFKKTKNEKCLHHKQDPNHDRELDRDQENYQNDQSDQDLNLD